MAKPVQKPVAKPAPKPAPKNAVATRPDPKPAGKPSTEIAKREEAAMPAFLATRAEQDAGKGVSTDASDNLIPLIYVLQPLSPQCLKGDPKYIPGAEAGMLWLRNAPEDQCLVDPEVGVPFQPCFFAKEWVEWQPDRGGYAGRHPERPDEATQEEEVTKDGQVRRVWRLANGNSVVETRYHSGYIVREEGPPLPYTIPLSSTGHTVSKAWMFQMNSEQLPNGATMPSFGILYRLSTELRTKNNKSWYQLTVKKEGYVDTVDDYERGLTLHNAFASGEKRVAEEGDDAVDVDGSAAGEGDDNL